MENLSSARMPNAEERPGDLGSGTGRNTLLDVGAGNSVAIERKYLGGACPNIAYAQQKSFRKIVHNLEGRVRLPWTALR
jgi:hypothetical protein